MKPKKSQNVLPNQTQSSEQCRTPECFPVVMSEKNYDDLDLLFDHAVEKSKRQRITTYASKRTGETRKNAFSKASTTPTHPLSTKDISTKPLVLEGDSPLPLSEWREVQYLSHKEKQHKRFDETQTIFTEHVRSAIQDKQENHTTDSIDPTSLDILNFLIQQSASEKQDQEELSTEEDEESLAEGFTLDQAASTDVNDLLLELYEDETPSLEQETQTEEQAEYLELEGREDELIDSFFRNMILPQTEEAHSSKALLVNLLDPSEELLDETDLNLNLDPSEEEEVLDFLAAFLKEEEEESDAKDLSKQDRHSSDPLELIEIQEKSSDQVGDAFDHPLSATTDEGESKADLVETVHLPKEMEEEREKSIIESGREAYQDRDSARGFQAPEQGQAKLSMIQTLKEGLRQDKELRKSLIFFVLAVTVLCSIVLFFAESFNQASWLILLIVIINIFLTSDTNANQTLVMIGISMCVMLFIEFFQVYRLNYMLRISDYLWFLLTPILVMTSFAFFNNYKCYLEDRRTGRVKEDPTGKTETGMTAPADPIGLPPSQETKPVRLPADTKHRQSSQTQELSRPSDRVPQNQSDQKDETQVTLESFWEADDQNEIPSARERAFLDIFEGRKQQQ